MTKSKMRLPKIVFCLLLSFSVCAASFTSEQLNLSTAVAVAQDTAAPGVSTDMSLGTSGAGDMQPPSFSTTLARMVPMFLMIFAVMYFMVIKPQRNKILEQEKMLSELKKGETVVLSSGLHARIVSVEADHVMVEPSANVKQKFERSAVVRKVA